MSDYEKLQDTLSEIIDLANDNQEFGHSMKVSDKLPEALILLEEAMTNLTEVADMVEQALGIRWSSLHGI